jgi:hypothetical protein
MPIIAPPAHAPTRLYISDVRHQVALIIAAAVAPKPTRIHEEWKLKVDIGKTTSLLTPEGEDLVHCWMIGAASIVSETGPEGQMAFVGNPRTDRRVDLTVWGFFDYALLDPDSSSTSQKIVEDEVELIGDYLKWNRTHLGLATRPSELKRVDAFRADNIDNHDFSDGTSLVVAQCVLPFVLIR